MDLIGFLYGFGVLHGLVLAGILLYYSGGHRIANLFMALLITCIAIRFLTLWMIRAGVFMAYPQWGMAGIPLILAWGPLLYLYARSVRGRPPGALQALHFLPCLLMFSAPISLLQYSQAEQAQFLAYFWSDRQNLGPGREVLDSAPAFWRTWVDLRLFGSVFTIQFASYCYLVLREIKQHNQSLEQHFSFTDEMNLRWLRTLTYLCIFFLLLFLIFNRARLVLYGQTDPTTLSSNTPFLFMVLVIYVIGIMALRQPRIEPGESGDAGSDARIDDGHAVTDESTSAPEALRASQSEPKKYARSGLSLEDAQRYKIRLMETMQNKQLYLNCDLTLSDLADEAGMSYHQASQVINGQLNQKFFSFVNNYRIQRAREMLADPQTSNMPIVELALEVGFKSKSSFYDAFKKATELTPTQFKKSLETA